MYKFMGNRACHWISFRKSWDINERRNWLTDWLTDWLGIGILGDVRILRWTFFPWSSCFPVIAFGFLTRRTPPPFLNGPSLSVNFHIRVFFISVKQGNCMYDRPRLNVEVELGSTIQFMCDLPLHLIYLRSYILGA